MIVEFSEATTTTWYFLRVPLVEPSVGDSRFFSPITRALDIAWFSHNCWYVLLPNDVSRLHDLRWLVDGADDGW